jgi:hypothetical protein
MSAFVVLDVGCVNDDHQKQSKSVDCNMAFPPRDLLSRIVFTLLTALCGLDRLAVNDRGRRSRILSLGLPNLLNKFVVNLFPCAVDSPSAENPVDGIPVWEIRWQVPPLASCAIPVDQIKEKFRRLKVVFADSAYTNVVG